MKTLKDIAQAMDCHPRTARRWWHKLKVPPDVVGHGPNRWKDRTFNRLIELWETFYKSRGTTLQITRAKYAGEPVRTATLAYDAVALVAALARTQGPQRFAPDVLTNASGFAGIDGLFRFRPDGTNERGLAVMRVGSGGGVPVAGSPKSFGA